MKKLECPVCGGIITEDYLWDTVKDDITSSDADLITEFWEGHCTKCGRKYQWNKCFTASFYENFEPNGM